MKAAVTLKQGLSFSGTAESGFSVEMGADVIVGGDDDGLRPLELLLISLASCTGMDVISLLRKKRQQVTRFSVHVEAEQSIEHPKVFTNIVLRYIVHGVNVDPRAIERSIELSKTKYCPIQAMLHHTVPIQHEYCLMEDA